MRAIVVLALAGLMAGSISGCFAQSNNESPQARNAIQELLDDGSSMPVSAGGGVNGLLKYSKPGSAPVDIKDQPVKHQFPGWENYGDWYVKALHDEMDTVAHVRLFTAFSKEDRYASAGFEGTQGMSFGFEIFGGKVVVLSPSLDFIGKNYWPFCDMDSATTSVDGGKAEDVATINVAGGCRNIALNGEAIRQFKTGSRAKLRLGSNQGSISLSGFADALNRAIELSK